MNKTLPKQMHFDKMLLKYAFEKVMRLYLLKTEKKQCSPLSRVDWSKRWIREK